MTVFLIGAGWSLFCYFVGLWQGHAIGKENL